MRTRIALLAAALVAALSAIVVLPAEAKHDATDHDCTLADQTVSVTDSGQVGAVFPPGSPGTKILFELSCQRQPTDVTRVVKVIVDDVLVSVLKERFFSGGTNGASTTEIHLPVRAVAEVCLVLDDGDPNTPEERVCVPPSSSS